MGYPHCFSKNRSRLLAFILSGQPCFRYNFVTVFGRYVLDDIFFTVFVYLGHMPVTFRVVDILGESALVADPSFHTILAPVVFYFYDNFLSHFVGSGPHLPVSAVNYIPVHVGVVQVVFNFVNGNGAVLINGMDDEYFWGSGLPAYTWGFNPLRVSVENGKHSNCHGSGKK